MKMRSMFIAPLFAAIFALISCSTNQPSKQVLMKFHAIQRIPGSNSVAIVLTEENGKNFLPLFVDANQALSIYLGQKEITRGRPLSHDLMAEIVNSLKAKVERIVITDLRDNIYFAELELRKGSEMIKVDARPSDAIALALRVHAPIFAMQHLLETQIGNEKNTETLSQVRVKSWGLTVQAVQGTLLRFFDGHRGVLVTQSEVNSPARQASVLAGDLIMSIDGESTSDLENFSEIMASRSAQASIDLEIYRDDETRLLTLTKHN
jgi:bifunctional DNase/RNase